VAALGLVAVLGAIFGAVLGVRYYNHHVGDWRIGVTAVAIGVGVSAAAVVAASVAWFVIDMVVSLLRQSIDVIPALIAIGAGVYLLSGQSTTGQSTWFSLIAHGIGAYFIAKGLFMARTTYLQADACNKLAQLVEITARAEPTTLPAREGTADQHEE
jgi:hypothetical protein